MLRGVARTTPAAAPRSAVSLRPAVAAPPAPADDALRCAHFASCSGCMLSEALHSPPLLSSATSFFDSFGVRLAFHPGSVTKWRTRARFAVRGSVASPILGLFEKGSHVVAAIPDCVAHHPRLNEAFDALRCALLEVGCVEPYDERTGAGELRYVQASCYGTAGDARVELVLVWNAHAPGGGSSSSGDGAASLADAASLPASLLRLARALVEGSRGDLFGGLWVNWNAARGNAVLGSGGWRDLLLPPAGNGSAPRWETYGGNAPCAVSVLLPPAAFAQANTRSFDSLLRRVASLVPRRSRIVELYAGCGALGLAALRAADGISLVCLESTPDAAPAFEAAVRALAGSEGGGAALAARVAPMVVASANDARAIAALFSPPPPSSVDAQASGLAIIVDPPRRGLDAATLAALCGSLPPLIDDQAAAVAEAWTLIYVSCGFKALARDAAALAAAGWRVGAADAWCFFPGTDSLETVVLFTWRHA